MVETWVVVTAAAAALQASRTALQQRLRGLLSVQGAGFVRYAYGAPVSLAALGVVAASLAGVPDLTLAHAGWCALAGIAQILGTNLLIMSFGARGFAVGTVYSKAETVIVALVGWAVLGEALAATAWAGILVCMAGVVALATRGNREGLKALARGAGDRAALYGLGAGAMFAVASVCIRAGALELGQGEAFPRAIATLAVMNSIQAVLMGVWLLAREPATFTAVFRTWRSSSLVGLLSVTGSAGWAWAMTLETAALVRAFGQVELVFTVIMGRLLLGETPKAADIPGSLAVILGVLLVLLA